jgi:hypothetical protein
MNPTANIENKQIESTIRKLFVEPLAHLPGIKVSLQGSIQFIGYLYFTEPATLCTSEKRATT